jgi:nucleoside 2-deoxyribosyltransferase
MTNLPNAKCPICDLQTQNVIGADSYGRVAGYACHRCGKFKITEMAYLKLQSTTLSSKLSAWVREKNETSNDLLEIGKEMLEEIERGLPDYSPSQKQIILLRNIERKTDYPGKIVKLFNKTDYPLAWAADVDEFNFYIGSLGERSLLRKVLKAGGLKTTENETLLQITAKGWDYLEQHKNPSAVSNQVFVAMSFSPSMESVWKNAIHPAIDKAGYKPYRVDIVPHIDKIDAKIITEIKNSRFIIADVTEQRQGVYFEAGFAMGLDIPVIWSVKKDDLKNVHFDTRQYNHIDWETEDDLKERLYYTICAVIGKYEKA